MAPLRSLLLAFAASSVAVMLACGTDPVGVEACRKIERARCERAFGCGSLPTISRHAHVRKRPRRDDCGWRIRPRLLYFARVHNVSAFGLVAIVAIVAAELLAVATLCFAFSRGIPQSSGPERGAIDSWRSRWWSSPSLPFSPNGARR